MSFLLQGIGEFFPDIEFFVEKDMLLPKQTLTTEQTFALYALIKTLK